MSLGTFFRFWVAALMAMLVLTLAYVDPAKITLLVDAEIQKADMTLGSSDTRRVVARTNELWQTLFADPVEAQKQRMDESTEKSAKVAAGLTRTVQTIMDRVKGLAYLAMFRLQWITEAIVPALIFIIAASVDGLAARRGRAFTFKSTSTVSFNTSSYAMVAAALLPLFYLIVPTSIPPVLPLLSGLGVAAAVWVFFAHLPGASPIIGMQT